MASKILTCDKCKTNKEVGQFAKKEQVCVCGGIMRQFAGQAPTVKQLVKADDKLPSPEIMTGLKEVGSAEKVVIIEKVPEIVIVPLVAPGCPFTSGQKVLVKPHDFMVHGVNCHEPGFDGVFIKDGGWQEAYKDRILSVGRRDKSGKSGSSYGGTYHILMKFIEAEID